ncbi:cytochrome c-type biogenesis protein (plasmid) [Deinococcus sp. VB343]
MRRTASWLLLSSTLPAATALTPEQEAQVRQIGAELRCPTCTGLPITESGDALSVQMRREVREQVKAGRSQREIDEWMVSRYGRAVLLKPPKQGLNLVLWGMPFLALGAGVVHFWCTLHFRQTRRGPHTATDPYLAQVRQATRPSESGDR